MLQKLLIALGFAFALVLSACAPPSDEPNALADAEQMDETEEVAAEEEAAPEPEPEPAPPPVAAKPKPRPAPVAPAAPPPPAVCNECGVVASIDAVKEKGAGSGAGAVIGAIAGGVIGHQFGGGRGKDVATAAGAIAGGAAGHEVEKRARGTSYFNVGVNMENGTYRTVSVADASALSVGSRVRVIGENIQLR